MSAILGTYARRPVSFSHGKGCYLYSTANEKYLDFVSGIAVNALGHCHDHLVKTVQMQAEKLSFLDATESLGCMRQAKPPEKVV